MLKEHLSNYFTKAIEQQHNAYTSNKVEETKDDEVVEQVEIIGGSVDENGNYVPDNQ